MNKRLVLFFLFYLVMVPLKSQVPGFFIENDKKKIKIPFYSSNSLIIVPVSVNGNYALNFLIDTGVKSNILFSKKLGDAMKLDYTRRINIVGADGSTSIWAQISPINTLDLGEVKGELQSLLVLEEDFFELEAVIGVPIYGIIGYEFFKYSPIKIDYDQSMLEFYKPGSLRWRPPFYKKLAMSVEDGKAYIYSKVKQELGPSLTAKLLIDTGANHGLLLNKETSEDITLPTNFIESELGQSLGGVLYGFIGRVNSLSIGGLKMKDVLTSYPEETSFSSVIKSTGRKGSIGSEVFGRTKLILDYPRNLFFVKKGSSFYVPFEFDMSGMVVKKVPNDENRYYVGEVRQGSPAYKSGILPYDEIISINKVPMFMWEMAEVFKLLRSEEGREIQLEMRRYINNDLENFSDYKVSLYLKKQI